MRIYERSVSQSFGLNRLNWQWRGSALGTLWKTHQMCQKPLLWKISIVLRAFVFEFGFGGPCASAAKCENGANRLGIRNWVFGKPIKYKALMGNFHAYLHNGKAKVLFMAGHGLRLFVRMQLANRFQVLEILRPPKCINMFKRLHLWQHQSSQNMQQVWPHLQVPKKIITNCETNKCTCKVVNVHLSAPKSIEKKYYLACRLTRVSGPIDNER